MTHPASVLCIGLAFASVQVPPGAPGETTDDPQYRLRRNWYAHQEGEYGVNRDQQLTPSAHEPAAGGRLGAGYLQGSVPGGEDWRMGAHSQFDPADPVFLAYTTYIPCPPGKYTTALLTADGLFRKLKK